MVDVECDNFFNLRTTSVTRGRADRLYKPSCTNTTGSHFFACRV